ncbi:MAG: hypothetical protein ACYTF8_00350 [Planctomycetota bacterium]|jgi:hypothetical protein
MRLWAAGLLALLASACKAPPYAPFDAGAPVHVIVTADPAPWKPIEIRPVTTLGPLVRKSPSLPMGGRGRAPGVEVALFLAQAGTHRLSVWEPRTWTDARADVEVEGETWVVMEIERGKRIGRLRVFDAPPHEAVGSWQPLVAVPD